MKKISESYENHFIPFFNSCDFCVIVRFTHIAISSLLLQTSKTVCVCLYTHTVVIKNIYIYILYIYIYIYIVKNIYILATLKMKKNVQGPEMEKLDLNNNIQESQYQVKAKASQSCTYSDES